MPIYIVTNREFDRRKTLLFGSSPNPKGIDELSVASAERSADGSWEVELHNEPDDLQGSSDIPRDFKDSPSFKLFAKLQKSMKQDKRNCVFLVHGYNVNFASALDTAWDVQERYGVEVILFTWPARGGGEGSESLGKDLIGTASYKRDKRIAAASAMALNRCLEKLCRYIEYSKKDCGQSFTLVCHSMGNYLLKNLMKSSIYEGETLLFDNILLAAADTNNANHTEWVDRIAHRRRIYVAINEKDHALAFSRAKLGEKQRARLGHYTKNLPSRIAIYLDFTYATGVGKSHGYFHDPKVLDQNDNAMRIFHDIMNGERAERYFEDYDPMRNIYNIT